MTGDGRRQAEAASSSLTDPESIGERQFRMLADTMPQIVWSTRADGYHDYYNQRWFEYTGLSIEDSVGTGWNPALHPDDRERAWGVWRHSLETGEPYEVEYRFRSAGGSYRWFMGRALPIRAADGTIVRWYGTCTDIHEFVETRSALTDSERNFRSLANSIPQLAWMADRSGWIFWYNQRWYDYTGTSLEEVQGWGWQAVQHPDHLARVVAHIRDCFEKGEVWEDTFPLRGRDGTYRMFLSQAVPIRDEAGGIVRWFGTNTDISDQIRTDAALRESEERLQLALGSSGMVGTWLWDVDEDRLYADERFARMYAVDPGRAAAGVPIAEFVQAIHPEDSERVATEIQRTLAAGGSFDQEYRVRQADGSVRWVEAQGRCSLNADGTPARFSGVAVDITSRKSAEEALELVSQELSHRIKNIFAVVGGLISLTARGTPDARPFAEALRARVDALARAHDYVRPHSPDSQGDHPGDQTVHGLLRTLLEPYQEDGAGRFSIEGDNVPIGPNSATTLALVLHESATNAVKYGALSGGRGEVRLAGTQREGDFELVWAEIGGPQIEDSPQRRGFGTLMAERAVTAQLGGTIVQDWSSGGLVMTLTLPIVRLAV